MMKKVWNYCHEPETNVVDNTDDERCMEIRDDDGIDVMPKPRNVRKGLDSKLKKKKTWTKLKRRSITPESEFRKWILGS